MTTTQGVLPATAPTLLTVDRGATSVAFAVKTFWGLMTVRGRFDRFGGWYAVGPEGTAIALTIEADSLDTGNPTRDKHLRSGDFFAVEEHPYVRFRSTRVRRTDGGAVHVEGILEAAGNVVRLEFDASVQEVGDGLQIEATTNVDQQRLGMSTGKLGMIRRPATLHVRALLNGEAAIAA